MENEQLPPELQELEHTLASRSLPEPSAELHQRILADVQVQLRAERRSDRWRFAVAVAAVVLIWMNLSMSATQATDFGFSRNVSRASGDSLEQMIAHLDQVAAELPPEQEGIK
jgi:hypothetical protein